MANRQLAVNNGRVGGNNILAGLSGLAVGLIRNRLQRMGEGEINRLIDQLTQRAGQWAQEGYNNVVRALRGQATPQQLGRLNRAAQQDRAGGNRLEEEADEWDAEEDDNEVEMNDGGSGGGAIGGYMPKKPSTHDFLDPMNNRARGPGIFEYVNTDRQTITVETPSMRAEEIVVENGKFYNLLAQSFTFDKSVLLDQQTTGNTGEVSYNARGLYYFNGNGNSPWSYYQASPSTNALSYQSGPAHNIEKKPGMPNTRMWGYVNHMGHAEGNFGSWRMNAGVDFSRWNSMLEAAAKRYRYFKLDKVEFRFTDFYVYSTNQIGQNITHALTPDIGTLLEIPAHCISMAPREANIRLKTNCRPGVLTDLALYCVYNERLVQQMRPELAIHENFPLKEYQTGWQGGDYHKSFQATKTKWVSTDTTLDQMSDGETGTKMGASLPNAAERANPVRLPGKPSLFIKHPGAEALNIHAGHQHTIWDMDKVLPDEIVGCYYKPFAEKLDISGPLSDDRQYLAYYNKGIQDASATFGGLGMSGLQNQPFLYIRKKTAQPQIQQTVSYNLQVRYTYTFAAPIDDGIPGTYNNINKQSLFKSDELLNQSISEAYPRNEENVSGGPTNPGNGNGGT